MSQSDENYIEHMQEENSNVSIQKQHTHSRKFSTQMSLPDIDKIINKEDQEKRETFHRTHSYSQSRHYMYELYNICSIKCNDRNVKVIVFDIFSQCSDSFWICAHSF